MAAARRAHRRQALDSVVTSYVGSELDIFQHATNWKEYYGHTIKPYVVGDVLEVGAGLGATSRFLCDGRQRSWTCLEPDRDLLAQLHERFAARPLPSPVRTLCGTVDAIAANERFDAILYIDVLEHIEDDREELQRVAHHLVDGGHIVIVAPAHNFLYTEFDRKIGHHRRYDKALLRAAVPAPLRITKMHYLDSVGMLASLANRLVLKSDSPSAGQIRLWDSVMVRASRWVVDALTLHRLGKSIVCILEKEPASGSTLA